MPLQIEINDSQIKSLTEFYILRLKVLRDEVIEREREIKDINATIQKLKKPQVSDEPKTQQILPDYSEKWPWLKKVSFAITQAGRALTTKEIVDVLTEYETSFIYDRKRAVASISSVLSSRWGADKEFQRTQSESGDFAYFLNSKEEEAPVSVSIVTAVTSSLQPEIDKLPF